MGNTRGDLGPESAAGASAGVTPSQPGAGPPSAPQREGAPPAGPAGFDYHGFVSYSTNPDAELVTRLRRFLDRFHTLPTAESVPLIELKLCTDKFEFAHEPGNAESTAEVIERFLGASRELIVLWSRGAAESGWVAGEIARFAELRGLDYVRLAVTEDFTKDELRDSLPPQAKGIADRIWYDLRGLRRGAERRSDVRNVEDELLRLACDLNGQPLTAVQPAWFREQRRIERRDRARLVVVASVLALLCVGLFVLERGRAKAEKEALAAEVIADERRVIAQARAAELASRELRSTEPADTASSMLLAAHAASTAPTGSAVAQLDRLLDSTLVLSSEVELKAVAGAGRWATDGAGRFVVRASWGEDGTGPVELCPAEGEDCHSWARDGFRPLSVAISKDGSTYAWLGHQLVSDPPARPGDRRTTRTAATWVLVADTATGRVLLEAEASSTVGTVQAPLALDDVGERAVWTSPAGRATVADLTSGSQQVLGAPVDGLRGYALDGHWLADRRDPPGGPRELVLWDLTEAKNLGTSPTDGPMALSAELGLVATKSLGTVQVWRPKSGKRTDLQVGLGVQSLAFGIGGRQVVMGMSDGGVRVWSIANPAERSRGGAGPGRVVQVAWSVPEYVSVHAGESPRLRRWRRPAPRAVTPVPHPILVGHRRGPDSLSAASRDGSVWVALGGLPSGSRSAATLAVHRYANRAFDSEAIGNLSAEERGRHTYQRVVIDEAGTAAAVQHERNVYVASLTGRPALTRLSEARRPRLDHMALAPDGSCVAASSRDRLLWWSLLPDGPAPPGELEGLGEVERLVVSPGCSQILSIGATAGIWDLERGSRTAVPLPPGAEVLAFHQLGDTWVLGGASPSPFLLYGTFATSPTRISVDSPPILIAAAGDGSRLGLVHEDGSVTALSTASNQLIRVAQLESPPPRGLALSDDGSLLAVYDKTAKAVRVFDLEADEADELGRGQQRGDCLLRFTADEELLALGLTGERIRWNPEELVALACGRVRQNLSLERWVEVFGMVPYQRTCPALPVGPIGKLRWSPGLEAVFEGLDPWPLKPPAGVRDGS